MKIRVMKKMARWVFVGTLKAIGYIVVGTGFWLVIAAAVNWLDDIGMLENVVDAGLLIIGSFLCVVVGVGVKDGVKEQYHAFERECEE